ncbi:MAG: translation-associated GTPase [Pseudomonadota bacterium]
MAAAGIVLAALTLWSLLLVVSRVLLVQFALDPWLFTFIQMMVGGAVLIAVSGQPRGLWALFGAPLTWIYGVLRVATAAFFTAALLYTSAANAAFLAILSVPTSALIVWGAMGRRPALWEAPGHAAILAGLVALAASLENGFRNPALVLMILSELCVVISTLIAERHPMNQTEDRRQRAALTGAMLVASAVVMLAVAAVAGQGGGGAFDPVLWGLAALVGAALRGPAMYLALLAIHRVKTTNYLAGMAALPLTALLFERAAAWMGLLAPAPLWTGATAFGGVMILGSLAVIAGRYRRTPGDGAD